MQGWESGGAGAGVGESIGNSAWLGREQAESHPEKFGFVLRRERSSKCSLVRVF